MRVVSCSSVSRIRPDARRQLSDWAPVHSPARRSSWVDVSSRPRSTMRRRTQAAAARRAATRASSRRRRRTTVALAGRDRERPGRSPRGPAGGGTPVLVAATTDAALQRRRVGAPPPTRRRRSGRRSERARRRGRRPPPASSARRHSSGTTSRPATSSSSGSTSWRTRLRRNRGSMFVGSSTGSTPRCAHRATVSGPAQLQQRMRRPTAWRRARSGPVPRSSRSSTVSAWSSAVCPSSAVGREHRAPGRACPGLQVPACGDAHRLGPELRRPTPAPARRPRSASRRRPGTQAVVDVHRESPADPPPPPARAAPMESGPAGHRTGHLPCPLPGTVQRDSRSATNGSSAGAASGTSPVASGGAHAASTPSPTRREPAGRVADLHERRQVLGPLERTVQQRRPADVLDRRDELLALFVLGQLGLEPDQPLQQLGGQVHLLAAGAQHPGEAFGAGHLVDRRAVHGHVAVALEQAHQAADPVHRLALVGDWRRARPPRRRPAGWSWCEPRRPAGRPR